MGVEAFGLVGVFITLQSAVAVLDIGISVTLNRELARLSAGGGDARRPRDLVFTLQAVYWLIALAAGVAVVAAAPALARHWVRSQSLPVESVGNSVRMMGFALALQFPFSFYQGGLYGLQRHVLLNGLGVALAALRGPGIVLALWLASPAPAVFFAGQVAVSAAGTGAVAVLLWRCLPGAAAGAARFDPALIRDVWRFSAASAASSVANLGLRQGDNLVLSRLLPLGDFGYYTLARGIANGLFAVIISVNGATFPQFSELVARGGGAELSRVYHRAGQLMAVVLAPAAVLAAIFSRELLTLWTGDPVIVENTRLILTLVVAGMLLHGLAQGPRFLQIAHGRWRLILASNAVLLLSIIPLYVLAARRAGGPGAAAVWVLLNFCYMLTVPLMHRSLLRGELWRWLFGDVCLPVGGALAVGAAARWLMPGGLSRPAIAAYLVGAGLPALAAAAALSSQLRAPLLARLRRAAEPFVA
jgi:O-antigen/teichoic acid export membrane protein